MLSTAIPARLEYQCGHAALVSLPRLKGETPAQRNTRIALEKSNALGRVCDFCAPRLEIIVEQTSAPVVVSIEEPKNEQDVLLELQDVVVQEPLAAHAPNGTNGTLTPAPARKRTAAGRAKGVPSARKVQPFQRFTIRFKGQQVLVATDIRDAPRQANSLGADELVAITRLK